MNMVDQFSPFLSYIYRNDWFVIVNVNRDRSNEKTLVKASAANERVTWQNLIC